MNPKFKAFFVSICYVLVAAFFLVVCFGLYYFLDVVGPNPECTDLQLAYFGVGLLVPLVFFSGLLILCEFLNLVCITVRRVAIRCQYLRHFHAHASEFFSPDSPSGDEDSGHYFP